MEKEASLYYLQFHDVKGTDFVSSLTDIRNNTINVLGRAETDIQSALEIDV